MFSATKLLSIIFILAVLASYNRDIKKLLISGDVRKVEQLVLNGEGQKLIGESSPNAKIRSFLKIVPIYMARIDMLHEAVLKGQIQDVKLLMSNATNGINDPLKRKSENLAISKDHMGIGLLHKSVYYDYPEITEWLVTNFPPTVHVRDKLNRIPLHYVSSTSDMKKIWHLLVNAGADVTAIDDYGKTPSYYMENDTELQLFDQEIKLNGNLQTDGRNIKHCNIRIWIHDQDLPQLQNVLWEGYGDSLITQTSNKPVTKKFLSFVPYVMGVIRKIHITVINGDFKMLEKLTRDPVPSEILTSKDSNGLTPLHKAVGLGYSDIAEYIIRKCPKTMNMTDKEGRTPLHYAASFKKGNALYEKLMKAGSNEHLIDKGGKTPKCYRCKLGEIETNLLHEVPSAPRIADEIPINLDWKLFTSTSGNPISFINRVKENYKINNSPDGGNINVDNGDDSVNNSTVENGNGNNTKDCLSPVQLLDTPVKGPQLLPKINQQVSNTIAKINQGMVKENLNTVINKDENTSTNDAVNDEENLTIEVPETKANEKISTDYIELLKDQLKSETNNENSYNGANKNNNDGKDTCRDGNNSVCHNDTEQDTKNKNEKRNIKKGENNINNNNDGGDDDEKDNMNRNDDNDDDDDGNNNDKSRIINKGKNADNINRSSYGDIENSNNNNTSRNKNINDKNNNSNVNKHNTYTNNDQKIIQNDNKTKITLYKDGNKQQIEKAHIVHFDETLFKKYKETDKPNNNKKEATETYSKDDSKWKDVIDKIMEEANIDQLADFVLEGNGDLLLLQKSNNQQIQTFIDNIPVYMRKIELIHYCCKIGNLHELQRNLDRRKFALARENKTGFRLSPLHVAVLFNQTSIARYLGGRFPETMHSRDTNGRTALHLASMFTNDSYMYNLLLTLGADKTIQDDDGFSSESYFYNIDKRKQGKIVEEYINTAAQIFVNTSMLLQNNTTEYSGIDTFIFDRNLTSFNETESNYIMAGKPLNEALLQIVNQKPENPVKFLADYLYDYESTTKEEETTQIATDEPHKNKQPNVLFVEDVENNTQITHQMENDDDKNSEVKIPKKFKDTDRDEYGQTTIHFAAARNHSRNAFLQMLQDLDINIGYRDELYRTARDIATLSNLYENVLAIDKYVLFTAVTGDTEKLLELTLEGYDHILDTENDSNIFDAVSERGHMATLSLLQSIPSYHERREKLHRAIRLGSKSQVEEIFKKSRKEAKFIAVSKNDTSRCSLHISVLAQHEDIIELIANKYPETLYIGDNLERTPLHYAMAVESVEIISKILIMAGAKRVVKDLKGRQPSYYYMNKSDILQLQQEEEILRI